MNEGRIFRILFHLLENDRATAPELAEELGVSVRTIYRDIDVMSISGIYICRAAEMAAFIFQKATN